MEMKELTIRTTLTTQISTKFTSLADKPNKIFSFDTCGMKFPVKHNYTRHLKVHDEPKETFSCDTCGTKFLSTYTDILFLLMKDLFEPINCLVTTP